MGCTPGVALQAPLELPPGQVFLYDMGHQACLMPIARPRRRTVPQANLTVLVLKALRHA
jgi:hypothetical protein